MFEQTFKNIDDILHKDAGCGSELDYVEQTSWVLFLKYLDDLEKDKATAAELSGKTYTNIISKEFQWTVWATPKDKDGKLDHHKALTGDDLKDFVDLKLFPYLKKFKADAESADTIEYKIGEIFSELKNRIQSGYNLREVINRIDELRFRTHAEKHEMSHLYEDKIKNMGNAGRNGGEYYTPRPLIKTIVKIVAPEIGNKIYDGAVGSAGFLVEAFEYLKHSKDLSPALSKGEGGRTGLTTKDVEILQKKTFYGKEKKSLAYIIGTMNMILHGIEAPNIVHTNTLAENLADIQEKDRYDIVLANPPFGGKERAEVQQNFPIKTGETASLFLQHFIKILKAGGKAGVVIKNTFLSNTDNASINLRKLLLENCNLHTVLDLPGGTFTGAGVKTVVLFFEKGSATKKVWYYQLNLNRNLGKTNALSEKDLEDFIEKQKTFADGPNSWSINVQAPKGRDTQTKGEALRNKTIAAKAPKGRDTQTKGEALRNKTTATKAPKGRDTQTKGEALRNKTIAAKAPKGRDTQTKGEALRNKTIAAKAPKGRDTQTKGEALRNKTTATKAPKGRDTQTKGEALRNKTTATKAPKGRDTQTKGEALRNKTTATKAPKGRDTQTKGVALRNKTTAAKALKGRNTDEDDNALSGLGSNYDLSAKNPNKKEEAALRQPLEILEEMKALDEESSLIMDNLQLIIDK